MIKETKREEFMRDVLKLVAPGTPLREGLDNVLRAKTGALIVVGYSQQVMEIVDGGFSINCDLNPANLYELAKMDGSIILSDDLKKILYANAQLIPDNSIPSTETGIRHRTAERVAKQLGNLVISISQRRNIITLYQSNNKYSLKDIGVILTKANQAIQTLEKYKSVLDQALTNLSAMEFEELATINDIIFVVHKIEMVRRVNKEIEMFTNELGVEGRLISMQAEELVANIDKEAFYLYKDYHKNNTDEEINRLIFELKKLSYDDLLDNHNIARALGYTGKIDLQEELVAPKGYRILSRIPRLPSTIIENLTERFLNLSNIMVATIDELDEVDGIGEVRAKAIKEGLKRIQENVFIGRHI